tara:strand:+ start:254 stop:931 length:678 start_codon:yes stop_codon:yes gene_type:complete
MAINIDTVYQKVLTFANKEQRGYITPQEFNLFADQAQKEIFEQYFYDLNQFSRIHGEEAEYIDIVANINEKISYFEKTDTIIGDVLQNSFPIYRLGTVFNSNNVILEEVQLDELLVNLSSPLLQPTVERPVYVRISENQINSHPASTATGFSYVKTPTHPSWGYIVVNGKAMWDPSSTTDFELHPAEESELVYKILKFAGISMDKINIMRAGQVQEQAMIQQEKQ